MSIGYDAPCDEGVIRSGRAEPCPDVSNWTTFLLPMLVLGIGMTIAVAPLTTVVMSAAGAEQSGVASGVNNAAARIAGLFAIAIFGVIALGAFNGAFNGALDARIAGSMLDATAEAAPEPFRSDLTGARLSDAIEGSRRDQLQALVDGAFVTTFRWVAGIAAALAALSTVCAALTIDLAVGREQEPEAIAETT